MFEEGLWIPICKLMSAGERNADVWKFILSNVRQPDHMAGDLHAQMASRRGRRAAPAARCATATVSTTSRTSPTRSSTAPRPPRAPASASCPAGTYHASARCSTSPTAAAIDIVCAITVDAEAGEITVDYEGSSRRQPVRASTSSRTTPTPTRRSRCGRCSTPSCPNNHGSLAPIKVDGARRLDRQRRVAAAVHGPPRRRHVPAQRAAQGARPDHAPTQAMAEGSGAVWTMQVSGNHDDGRPFITAMFTYAGGVGARAAEARPRRVLVPDRRGGGADRGRRGVGADPVPAQGAAPPAAAAPARQTGGLGQTIEFTVDTDRPWQLNAVTSPARPRPPQGIFGGEAGAAGSVHGQRRAGRHAGARHAAAGRRRAPRPARRRRLRSTGRGDRLVR